jgi:hypothetical protein
MMKVFGVMLAVLSASGPQLGTYPPAEGLYVCRADTTAVCGPNGCTTSVARSDAEIRIDLNSGWYQRCDSRGCDSYEAEIYPSGIYIIAELPGRATFAKLETPLDVRDVNSMRYIEVATAGVTAFLHHGVCLKQN